MEDSKGDHESLPGKVTADDADVAAENDKTGDNNDDERNEENDDNNEAHEKTTAQETSVGRDEIKGKIDEENNDDDKNSEEGEKDEEGKVEDEEVEKDDASPDSHPEEGATNDADDNNEAEVCEGEPTNEGDTGDGEEEAENENEEAAAEVEEEKEEEEEDEKEEAGTVDLTEEEITRCQHIFDKKAIDGRLDLKGFKLVFRVLGEIVASDEAELMFDTGDRDGDNTIDFDEFLRLYSKYRQQEQVRREAILDSVDKLFLCGPGDFIELRKVQQLLLKLQQPDLDARLVREKSDLGVDEVKRLVKSLDTNGSGSISKQEFVSILCEHLDM